MINNPKDFTTTVVQSVADKKDADPVKLKPFYEEVGVFPGYPKNIEEKANVKLSFEYEGYRVYIENKEIVSIEEVES